jgi:hypothetical protein
MHSPANSIKHAKKNKNIYIYIIAIYFFQILDLIPWHREMNLFCTLLYLTIIKK